MDCKPMREKNCKMNKHTPNTESYFWVSLSLMLVSNVVTFQGSHLLTKNLHHFSLALPVDSALPFIPWTISIYFGCFLFWFAMYRLIARLPRERADRFFCANLLGKSVCFFVFLLFPTAIRRPEVNGMTVWDSFMRFLYWIDSGDNIFPSLHCMIAWLCWVGVRGNKQVPLLWRILTLIMAILVCLSTLTTRQHVLLDVFGGILLSEFCYCLSDLPMLHKSYTRLIDWLINHLFSIRTRCFHE